MSGVNRVNPINVLGVFHHALLYWHRSGQRGPRVRVRVCEMNEMWQLQPFGGDLHS